MDKIARAIAYRLPKRVKFYCGVYILTYATMGKYGKTVVPELSALEAIDRFHRDLIH